MMRSSDRSTPPGSGSVSTSSIVVRTTAGIATWIRLANSANTIEPKKRKRWAMTTGATRLSQPLLVSGSIPAFARGYRRVTPMGGVTPLVSG